MHDRTELAELWSEFHGRQLIRNAEASLWRAPIAVFGAALAIVLEALHESRRRQSARELARHRQLIDAIDPTAGGRITGGEQ